MGNFTFVMTLALTTMGFVLIAGCNKNDPEPIKTTYQPLDPTWSAQLIKQRALIQTEIQHRYGYVLTASEADIHYLQHLLDDYVYTNSQKYELQSIGICFGDILAKKLNLEWVLITDPWGTDPTLRYKNTSIVVNALTMISKRVEDSRGVELQELYSEIIPLVTKMISSEKYK